MTTQYTPTLKLALPVTGELSGTWGDVVNDNITSMIEQAIAGLSTINTWTSNAHTLTTASGTTSESRCAMLVAATGGGAPTAAAQIICPAAAKLYVLQNNTSFAVTLKTSAGTGVAVAAGDTAFLFCDSTNVNSCVTTIVDGHITGNLTVDGNTTLGNATSDTITATARFNTDLIPSTDNARDLGSSANSWKDLYIDGTATIATLNVTTIDTTNLEVTNIKAKDGTAALQIADTTGVVSVTAAPVMTALTASKPVFTDASKALTSSGTLAYDQGGTGQTSYAAGDIVYANATNTLAKLTIGSSGQRLVVAAGLPSWATDATIGTVTSVAQSFTGGIVSVAGSPITTSGTLALTVAGNSGGVPYFSTASTWASSNALAASALVIGGGAGAAPSTTTTGTGVVTALGVNTGTAGAFVVNGGALGSPSTVGTMPAFTLGGTVSGGGNQINNVIIGNSSQLAGSFTTLSASDTITSTKAGLLFTRTGASTSAQYFEIGNTSGLAYFGVDNSSGGAGGVFFSASATAYDTSIAYTGGLQIGPASGQVMARFTSAGLAVTGTLSATGAISASRARSNTTGDMGLLIAPSDTTIQYGFRIDSNNNNLNLDYYTGSAYTNRVVLDNAGNLGLGVTPSAWSTLLGLQVRTASLSEYSETAYLSANAYYAAGWKYINANYASQYIQTNGQHQWWSSTSAQVAGTNPVFSQAMTLDASGNLGIGTTNPSSFGGKFTVLADGSGTGAANTVIGVSVYESVSANAAGLWFGSMTNQNTGVIGSRTSTGNIAFQTYNAGWGERMRLTYDGNLLVGTTSASGSRLDVRANSTSTTGDFRNANSVGYGLYVAAGSTTSQYVQRWADYNNNTLATIDGVGNLLVGVTSPVGARIDVASASGGAALQVRNDTAAITTVGVWNDATSGDNTFVKFYTEAAGTTRGSITYNRAGGLVAYNVTSDYRAKDIYGPVQNPGALIDSVPVYMGKMKDATQERPMFIAHEVPAYAHTGEKDAVDKDGKPVYQQMDASALIPVMWAELQSLRARVAQLESKP